MDAADSFANPAAAVGSSLVLPPLRTLGRMLLALCTFAPPFGGLLCYSAYRRLNSFATGAGRDTSLLDDISGQISAAVRDPLRLLGRPPARPLRSLDVDAGDAEIAASGGIDGVRTRLLLRSLDGGEERDALREGLALSVPPRGCREGYVTRGAAVLQRLGPSSDRKGGDAEAAARLLLEVRCTDSLLRVVRDRLVKGAHSLAAAQRRWRTRVGARSVRRPWRTGSSTEQDRENLAATTALYRKTLERLGRVQGVLMDRPRSLDGMYGGKKVGGAPSDSHFEAALQKEMERWYDAARRWMGEGKLVMRDIITEIMEETDQDTDDVANDAMALLSKWALGGTDAAADAERLWTNAVSAIAVAERAQRAGNRSVLRGLPIFGDSKYWWAQDVVVLAASYALHLAVAPHWDGISSAATRSWEITKGIAMRRFIRPAADIVDDLILNRRPRLLDRAILADAELSLDNMLMDLRLAERTEGRLASSARAAALSAASREYEAQLASGTIRNLLWGNSARLILVQVQQLKAEMLRAFGAIDDLVDANRLNVQLLAAIPSVLLAFGATRLFVVGMFALRSRDGLVRSMRDVHEEMEDHLLGMERCVMLAKAKGAENDKGEVRKPSRTNTEAGAGCGRLRGMELGEFVLLSHSYLILLDYSSPVVSSRAADVVHQDVQNLLSIGSFCVNVDQQAALLNSIKARHKKLLRF